MVIPVSGQTPGRRYGHSLVFKQPYLLLFGGNTGKENLCDVWCLNIEIAPFCWKKVKIHGEHPSPRCYHSAAICNQGRGKDMMIIFGGKSTDPESYDQVCLGDTWGLKRSYNGIWSWV
jgi:protein phosphatase